MIAEIQGRIQPKGRPRFARQGAFVKTYTPKGTRACEEYIRTEYIRQTAQKEPYHGAVTVSIDCFYLPPKSTPKTRRESMIGGEIEFTKKPDLDNVAKTVLDALNGVAWDDDKQITSLHVTKGYGKSDYVLIGVDEVEKGGGSL